MNASFKPPKPSQQITNLNAISNSTQDSPLERLQRHYECAPHPQFMQSVLLGIGVLYSNPRAQLVLMGAAYYRRYRVAEHLCKQGL